MLEECVSIYMSKHNSIPNKSKFKNLDEVEYKVLFRKHDGRWYGEADGICQSPDEKNPKIFINPYLTDQSELNTIIHEIAHAYFWDKTEKEIAAYSNTVSRFLYNWCGWRKTRNRQEDKVARKRASNKRNKKK